MTTAVPSSLCLLPITLLFGFVLQLTVQPAGAAEPTEPEQLYERLKDAEKHADRLLGDRWNKLVRQRQWVDSTGKHKTYARYLEHDPNLQSVRLLILVKKGEESIYKEGTIPLARLSKNDQAIVKRIASMREQVDEALADAPAADAAVAGEMASEGAFGDPYRATAETSNEAPADVPPPPAKLAALAMIEPWRTDFNAFAGNIAPQQDAQGKWMVTWTGLPAFGDVYSQEQMLHQLKSGRSGAQFAAADPAVAAPGQSPEAAQPQPEAPAAPPGREGAFGGGPRNEFLEEPPPADVAPQAAAPQFAAPAGPPANVPGSAMFMLGAKYGWSRSGLGEVSWETTIQSPPTTAREPLQHDLQLPSPLTLELVPETAHASEYAKLNPGERIRFVGRFERVGGFDDPPKVVLKVRPLSKAELAAARQQAAAAPTSEEHMRFGPAGAAPSREGLMGPGR